MAAANMDVKVEGNIMTIQVDLTQVVGQTKRGSNKAASTNGFLTVPYTDKDDVWITMEAGVSKTRRK